MGEARYDAVADFYVAGFDALDDPGFPVDNPDEVVASLA
jgi:hypothetical protein